MIRIAIVLSALLYGLPAAAEDVTAGKRGGFWCSIETDFTATIAGKFQHKADQVGPSCEKIRPLELIREASKVNAVAGGVTGRADFMYGPDAFFMVYLEPREFKRVAPADVRNAPDKWQGRPIEFSNVRVYWVGNTDIRVITDTNVTLFAARVKSSDDTEFFSRECETEAEALSPKCRATARFVYAAHSEDTPSGFLKRTVLMSHDVELTRRR